MSTNNSILVIQPYLLPGSSTWVFDEPRYNLVKEAFVLGASEVMTELSAHTVEPEKGFTLLFSKDEFPTAEKFTRLGEEMGGNWYVWDRTGMVMWLCPALFHFFPEAPENLYGKAESLK